MHIEPGIVEGSKTLLGYATSAAAAAYTLKLTADSLRQEGLPALLWRALLASGLTFLFFEVFPHQSVGVSEVHLILGSTLLLLLGVVPAAIGLAAGLLIQGLLFAPTDLPQLGMNLTTLLVPLFITQALARKVIPAGTAYVDITYRQALRLSLYYQGGIVAWVAFWALFGQGLAAENLMQVATFGAAYMTVVLIEPLVDLAALAAAKHLPRGMAGLLQPRVHGTTA